MTNKEKFLKLVSKDENNTLARNRQRIENRYWLQESRKIALEILFLMEMEKYTTKDLAQELEISMYKTRKILSGKSNLTLDILIKLRDRLGMSILK